VISALPLRLLGVLWLVSAGFKYPNWINLSPTFRVAAAIETAVGLTLLLLSSKWNTWCRLLAVGLALGMLVASEIVVGSRVCRCLGNAWPLDPSTRRMILLSILGFSVLAAWNAPHTARDLEVDERA
jgi:hypothetical protein